MLLLAAALLSAFQISAGVEGLPSLPLWAYTIGFGTLLVSCLMFVILGFKGLESKTVVIVSTAIPLCISLGLVSHHLPTYSTLYLIFCAFGFTATGAARFFLSGKTASLILAVVHRIAGILITAVPLVVVIK